MITRIIKIGNSRGLRIPKLLLEQSGISEEVKLDIQGNKIIISSISAVRAGWDKAFSAMAKNKDDRLLDEDELVFQNQWDNEEWDW